MGKFSSIFLKTQQYVAQQGMPMVKRGMVELGKIVAIILDCLSDNSDQIWTIIKIVGGIILLFTAWPLLLLIFILRYFSKGASNRECPKCDSMNLKVVKAGRWNHLMQQNVAMWVPGAKISKPLNVCRDCGFSWEDR